MKDRFRIFLVIVGLLDLYSLLLHWRELFHLTMRYPVWWLSALYLALLASLAFSGVLLLLQKKSGLILYYFQFPLRLAFHLLTFGLLTSLLSTSMTMVNKIVYGVAIGLETIRLLVTVMTQKK